MKARENASAALLNYGFTFYDTQLVVKGGAVLASAHVWKARDPAVDLGIKDDLYVTLPRGEADDIKTAAEVQPRLIAPLDLDASLGTVRVFTGNQTAGNPAAASLAKRWPPAAGGGGLIDTIRLWFA